MSRYLQKLSFALLKAKIPTPSWFSVATSTLNFTPSVPSVSVPVSQTSSSRYLFNRLVSKRTYCTSQKPGEQPPSQNQSKPSGYTFHTTPKPSSRSKSSNINVAMYSIAAIVGVGALSYAAVPLYKMYCSATGYGGTTKVGDSSSRLKIIYDHPITVRFTSQVSDTLPWSFSPIQKEMTVLPGEKALAFYIATNHSNEPLVGVATYNVVPDTSGAYFNKIQCFCFDEQRLNPGETVNMPIHFFIDPEIENDQYLKGINEITLSYTFFLADDQSSEWWEEEREKHARPSS